MLLAALLGAYLGSLPVIYGAAILGACVLKRNALPSLSLWLLVLIPIGYMDSPKLTAQFLTPAVVVTAIWLLRLATTERLKRLLQTRIRGWIIALPFFALLGASTYSSERIDISLSWALIVAICVVAPALVGQTCIDDVWPSVRWTFAGIGLFLGILASFDFLLGLNPWTELFRAEYRIGTWSVFRSRTSLGHPLTSSTVASVALAVCIFPSGASRRWPYWVCAAGAAIALILAVSRTSVFAVVLAAAVGALSASSRTRDLSRGRGRFLTVSVAVAASAAVAWSPLLRTRNQASEGLSSAANRSETLDNVLYLILQRPILGFGPGSSPEVYQNLFGDRLENSAFQLVVSLGIPAFAFFTLGIGSIVLFAMKRSRAGVGAGIAAFFVSASGFNLIDVLPSFFVLIAPLIVCAVTPKPSVESPVRRPDPAVGLRARTAFSDAAKSRR